MQAEIISIGTEILMGEIVDTNSVYLASELPRLGVELHSITKVGDDLERLAEVMDRAWRRSDVILTSGGLGPTTDDLTREAIGKLMGEEMKVQDDLLEHLRSLFSDRGIEMPDTNIKQATLIPSAQSIPNPLGTAPGWWVEKDGRVIAAMPGPPREMMPMWESQVAPRLRKLNPGVAIVTRTLKTMGITEGGLDEMIAPLFDSANPRLGIYSRADGIHLRAIATAPTEEEARKLITPMEEQIRGIVGDAIWGEDGETVESKVASLLTTRDLTLGIMESFTGGVLAGALTEAHGSHRYLKGSIVVLGHDALAAEGVDPGLIADYGSASPQVAEAMARAARHHFGADVGVGVSELVMSLSQDAGTPGTLHIGFDIDGGTCSASVRIPARGPHIRSRAVSHALRGLLRVLGDT